MRAVKKGSMSQNSVYCAHCFIRLGIGERQIVCAGKAYHPHCEAKIAIDNRLPHEKEDRRRITRLSDSFLED